MAGTWTSQNKIEPGIYINVLAAITSALAVGDRGVVLMLQEMSVGTAGDIYTVTADDASGWPIGATTADKFLAGEALKKAKTVKVLNLGTTTTKTTFAAALAKASITDFDVLCYPYAAETLDGDTETTHAQLEEWLTTMIEDDGRGIQLVAPDFTADNEAIVNVAHAVVLSDGTTLTNAQACAWVAGATAGAGVNQSNTGAQYDGAVDVSPRMAKSAREAAITAGKFIFVVDNSQNVSADYDINSLTTTTATKTAAFKKNRFIRLKSSILNDIDAIFNAEVKGKYDNNADGRTRFKTRLVEYFNALQSMNAIQGFSADDVTVAAGTDKDAVLVTVAISSVDSIEKVYMTVNCS